MEFVPSGCSRSYILYIIVQLFWYNAEAASAYPKISIIPLPWSPTTIFPWTTFHITTSASIAVDVPCPPLFSSLVGFCFSFLLIFLDTDTDHISWMATASAPPSVGFESLSLLSSAMRVSGLEYQHQVQNNLSCANANFENVSFRHSLFRLRTSS
ncbi:hypothetical protein D9613_012830 [Agrocybe pediades]|uniref:Uncharacterized protein n=1 Tax=Agrocybe pediades TaxID=84607 RepID=A0A8H4R3T4_9AGAR|nr:hypothetical protein D9613_012830 [Agrocybe pediades]